MDYLKDKLSFLISGAIYEVDKRISFEKNGLSKRKILLSK